MGQKFEVEIPDDGHLAESKDKDETYRGTILDDETNQIKGQATLIPIDDEDDTSFEDDSDSDLDFEADAEGVVIVGLLFTLAGVAFAAGKAAYDHRDDIKDFFRRKFHKSSDDIDIANTGNEEALEGVPSTELSHNQEQSHDSGEASQFKMTGEEYRQHLCRYFLSLVLAEAEKRRLESADITDDVPDDLTYLDFDAIHKKVNTLFDESPALLEKPMLNRISSLLSGRAIADAEIQRALDDASRSGGKSITDK
ncbi:hypothetical protein ACOVJN_06005 [Scardovia wiggsiae]